DSHVQRYLTLRNLRTFPTRRSSDLDMMEFQLKEINNVNPQTGEEEQLENELNKLENVEDISLSVENSLRILYEDEQGTYASLSQDRKSTRLNSSHVKISYAVFCLR